MLLRGSVATEYYKASGGDILATQDVLNHTRTDTTDLYIKGPQTCRIQRETIARLQVLMLGWIVGMKADAEEQVPCDQVCGRPGVPALRRLPALPGTGHSDRCRTHGACSSGEGGAGACT